MTRIPGDLNRFLCDGCGKTVCRSVKAPSTVVFGRVLHFHVRCWDKHRDDLEALFPGLPNLTGDQK